MNFNEAIAHDFQSYNTGQRRIDHLIQFGEFFSKKDILLAIDNKVSVLFSSLVIFHGNRKFP